MKPSKSYNIQKSREKVCTPLLTFCKKKCCAFILKRQLAYAVFHLCNHKLNFSRDLLDGGVQFVLWRCGGLPVSFQGPVFGEGSLRGVTFLRVAVVIVIVAFAGGHESGFVVVVNRGVLDTSLSHFLLEVVLREREK